MNEEQKYGKPLGRAIPRKRRMNFSYLVTVGLMVMVIFVAMEQYGQRKNIPVGTGMENDGQGKETPLVRWLKPARVEPGGLQLPVVPPIFRG
jgi:hypothetical protein